ncbi:MAG: phosphoglucosamine mutase [Clostridiales bacterium]|jgi:phosphoglucosamine mutase|nr:phosphoglucosamine mutase [Clostridiales bacterium]
MAVLFGTDGVRGVANKELTPRLCYAIGRAGAHALARKTGQAPVVLIGTDTRKSAFMLCAALSAGVCSVGGGVLLAGVIPTPGIAYLTRHYGCTSGVMISASHNSFEDNGVKFFDSSGYKLPDETEAEIEDFIFNRMDEIHSPAGEKVGTGEHRDAKCLEDYENFLLGTAPGLNLAGLSVVVDCANGATSKTAAEVLARLGAKLTVLNNQPDGLNINRDCGSTHMTQIMETVKALRADCGIAFDGDGDRCHFTDENGKLLDGDEIMALCAAHLKAAGKLKSDTLVATVMSNLGLFKMGEASGLNIEQTAVGDRYVLERMLSGGFSLGGEKSGHIIFLDHNTTGDGLLTALQVLKIMKERGRPLSELNTLKLFPQVLINAPVKNENKSKALEHAAVFSAYTDLCAKLAGRGRVLVRPSGTERYVRVMLEGEDEAEIEREARALAELITSKLN